jgi:predicted ribosomally synthesized peptide with nif11-like leader
MSAEQMNAFLRHVASDTGLQAQLRHCDANEAAELAAASGFEVTVGDLTRYKARATSWQLRDDELEVVARWQAGDQPFWWQYIWTGSA